MGTSELVVGASVGESGVAEGAPGGAIISGGAL